ncbi:MAG: class I SAM-dependent methyltransferase [Pseudarcicella sp.]|nr:class I SAM-dependent methyltransferase [Pseudarcicella sp.]
MTLCKVCNSKSEIIFDKIILNKYKSNYYKCTKCSFVQTDEPFWFEESYLSAITSLDIGLPQRNLDLKEDTRKIINSCFSEAKLFLDYAGGYGLFVRYMRDQGFDFYRQDDYCENLFAKHFDVLDTDYKKFDVVTAFEVFEHFRNPIEEIEKVLKYSDTIIFSTELLPSNNTDIENWWYITNETGQHIAFYSEKTMRFIAEKFNLKYYNKNNSLHIFTSKSLTTLQLKFAFKKVRKYSLSYFKGKFYGVNSKIKRNSLLEKDYNFIKNNLYK